MTFIIVVGSLMAMDYLFMLLDLWFYGRKKPKETPEQIKKNIREGHEKLDKATRHSEQTMWLDYIEHWEQELKKVEK